ncbi:Hsp20/alpha crystallin family protein [Thermodesulfobacteriota bacterium]
MIFRKVSSLPTTWRGPFDELERMRSQMDRLFSDLSERNLGPSTAGVFPLINMTENNDNFYIRAELPGVNSEDLDISVTGDTFTISGERKIPDEKNEARYHRREREAGNFNRVITLPSLVQPDKVEAESKNGVLTIVLPKAEETKPRQISIKAK